jgi:hypothetical protein
LDIVRNKGNPNVYFVGDGHFELPELNDGASPPPLQAAGFRFQSCQRRVQSPADAYGIAGGGRSP